MDRSDFHSGLCDHVRFEVFDTITAVVRGSENANVRFIEVGANDGSSGHDPVFPYVIAHHWEGVLVEPVPYLFDRLQKNYPSDRKVKFVRAACGAEEGFFTFYEVDKAAEIISPVAPFLSSFDKNVILNHVCFVPDLERYINEVKIVTKRADTIAHEAGVHNVHILVTDTEGHDDKVLEGWDFGLHRPMAVYMEHKHLRYDAFRNVHARMTQYGYHPIWMFEDVLYVQPSLFHIPMVNQIAAMMEQMYRV